MKIGALVDLRLTNPDEVLHVATNEIKTHDGELLALEVALECAGEGVRLWADKTQWQAILKMLSAYFVDDVLSETLKALPTEVGH